MAQRAGFFNALLNNGVYDRRYNADDYRNNLAVIISDGVLRSDADDLRATANGLSVNIGIGRAWIRGAWYENDTDYQITVSAPSTANPRRDRIMLRFDNSLDVRNISLHYAEGIPAANPTPPDPMDTDTVKDLVLCDILVPVNATAVTVTDTRAEKALCGWVYSVKGDDSFFETLDNNFNAWFAEKRDQFSSSAMFVQYTWQGQTSRADQTQISFDIPQYDPEGINIIQVYLNGFMLTEGDDYTLSESVITFAEPKEAGQEVTVLCYRSVDATGINTIVDEVTELQNKVTALTDFTDYNYICTGVDDNIKLSQIAQDFLNGSTTDNRRMKINVYGTVGVSSPFAGSGTPEDPYQWFKFGQSARTNRRVIFDFSHASRVNVTATSGASHCIFHGEDIFIRDAYVAIDAAAASTPVTVFNSVAGRVNAEDVSVLLNGYNDCKVASTGFFKNCSLNVRNSGGNSVAFQVSNDSLLRLDGGEVYAYAQSGKTGYGIGVTASITNGCVICNGVSFPTYAVSGLSQTYAIYDVSNNGLSAYNNSITTLLVSAAGQQVNGTLATNKFLRV